MTSICARARASEIWLSCARLEAEQTDELKARAKLLLRSSAGAPSSILVACDEKRSWVVWNGPPAEVLDVRSEGDLVEALLDAIDKRVRASTAAPSASAPTSPRTKTAPPSPHETPTWEMRDAAQVREPGPLVESGGLGVGLIGESPTARLGPALGPRLDVGVGWGPWSLQLTESARFANTRGGDSAFLYDVGGGVGWGAPFSRQHPIGAALTAGNEWFNVRSNTLASGFIAFGLRGAAPVGPLAIALGIEGRFRFASRRFNDADVQIPRWSGLLFLEGVLLVEPAQPHAPARPD